MWIKPKILRALKNTGLTYKEGEGVAKRLHGIFESLPTAKELAKRCYDILK